LVALYARVNHRIKTTCRLKTKIDFSGLQNYSEIFLFFFRILKLAGGLITKDKFKVKREKILTKGFGRSRKNPRKTLVEEVLATRSAAQCKLLTNDISGKQIQLDLN